ncbi:sensor histidine kinase [Alistipes shahii]|uniref:sensor histidine kinase n=1 Tax=Alistipes shahii TaxID=328814 RepID=UPI003CF7A131
MNATKTILDWKNVVWLSLVSYGVYMVLWLVIDDEIWQDSDQFSAVEVAVDFCICALFVGLSLFYSRTVLRMLPLRNKPYMRLLLMACVLFLLNNAMAYAMTVVCDTIWGDESNELFRMQGIYSYGMIATFVSCIYSNAFYLETYMRAEDEKRRLEIALLKEQEVALQSQLDALKSQIDTHFMFNNFSILAELIEEDRALAGKFLANLSKVYRYIIQNMKRHKVPVGEEIAFLDAYLYLIEMRYGKAVVVRIENDVRLADGSIPPACLQLLVENAIKHNRHSVEQPLHIDIRREGDHISVCNLVAPLLSAAEPSTGIGQKNIAERYALLSDRQMIVSFTSRTYVVKLPILEN